MSAHDAWYICVLCGFAFCSHVPMYMQSVMTDSLAPCWMPLSITTRSLYILLHANPALFGLSGIPKNVNRVYQGMLHFSSPAPTGPPLNFTVIPEARTMTFSWAPPNATRRNGVITGYSLSCAPQTGGGSISMQPDAQAGNSTLMGFTPATAYNCSIFACNSQGNGPAVSMIIRTLEACKLLY